MDGRFWQVKHHWSTWLRFIASDDVASSKQCHLWAASAFLAWIHQFLPIDSGTFFGRVRWRHLAGVIQSNDAHDGAGEPATLWRSAHVTRAVQLVDTAWNSLTEINNHPWNRWTPEGTRGNQRAPEGIGGKPALPNCHFDQQRWPSNQSYSSWPIFWWFYFYFLNFYQEKENIIDDFDTVTRWASRQQWRQLPPSDSEYSGSFPTYSGRAVSSGVYHSIDYGIRIWIDFIFFDWMGNIRPSSSTGKSTIFIILFKINRLIFCCEYFRVGYKLIEFFVEFFSKRNYNITQVIRGVKVDDLRDAPECRSKHSNLNNYLKIDYRTFRLNLFRII